MPEHIELVSEVCVDQVVAGKVLVQVLLTVLPVGVGVSRHSGPDLLLHHDVHVAAGEGVASAEDAGDHDHQGAQAAVHDDLKEKGSIRLLFK